MGRDFRNVAVVKAYDAQGVFVIEDIVPSASFDVSGSILLNVAEFRAARGIRFISFRRFNDAGVPIERASTWYDLHGSRVPGLHRRPDGTIIETPDWV
jgi:hypothetical protein